MNQPSTSRNPVPFIDLESIQQPQQPNRWDNFAVPAPVHDPFDYDNDLPPPNPHVLRIMEHAPEPDPYQLTQDKFVDTQAIKDFECVVCMDIVFEHNRSQTCNRCLKSLCPNTCLRAYKVSNPSYTRRCPACREPFRFRNRPRTGPKSIEKFDQLLVHCFFSPSCQEIMILEKYPEHVNICKYNVVNCNRCSSKGGNQEIHLGYCMDELSSIHAELEDKKQSLTRAAITIEVQKQMIEDLKAQLRQKENELQQNSSDETIATISNPVRSLRPTQGKYTKFTIRYLDQTFQIENLSLDAPGSVLRSEIERLVGGKVGTILRADHTIISDEKLLRQHQLCYQPKVITVLPADFIVNEGAKLRIQINKDGR
uniref:Uncharacterized protein n=1 Tax=Tetranychus urticae TaxID=32264 RepID=T1K4D1_TETUR